MAFDVVDENNVYTCVGHPLAIDISNIVTWMLNESFTTSYTNILNLKTDKGLALQDIVTEVHTYVHRLDLPQRIRIELLIKLAELEERLVKGTSEKIQLGSMISVFQITRDMVREDATLSA
jgi:replication factor C subunit 3/5